MHRAIAINGARLDQVQMLLEPYGNGSQGHLSYPKGQFRISGGNETLRLVVPAYLAVELYRTAILPQDPSLPVEISIGGSAAGWFTVSDVRYFSGVQASLPQVGFAFIRVRQRRPSRKPPRRASPATEGGAYLTDITHFLDETGELMTLPGPARKLASFLTLVIEAATDAPSEAERDSGIRCRTEGCTANVRTVLPPNGKEILWRCPACGHHGSIRNWRLTKWNQLKHREERD